MPVLQGVDALNDHFTWNIKMERWLEAALVIFGATITTYALIQNHDYRIGRLETGLNEHIDKHELQAKEIDARLGRIELAIGRIETKLEAPKK